jgi:hypothetical protein
VRFHVNNKTIKTNNQVKKELYQVEPDFGIEDTVKIDKRLELPAYYYNERNGELNLDMYKIMKLIRQYLTEMH